MVEIPIFDNGIRIGYLNIPHEVIAAAAVVSRFFTMNAHLWDETDQPPTLYGLSPVNWQRKGCRCPYQHGLTR